MIKGTTKSGFNYEISEKRLKNYELFEAIAEAETNELAVPRMVKLLFGEQQAQGLKNHYRDEEGLVDGEAITEAIKEVFEKVNTLKNL